VCDIFFWYVGEKKRGQDARATGKAPWLTRGAGIVGLLPENNVAHEPAAVSVKKSDGQCHKNELYYKKLEPP